MKRPNLVTRQEKIANYSISNDITEKTPYIPPKPATPPKATVPGKCGRPKGAKNKTFSAPAQPRKLRSTPATPPEATVPAQPRKRGRPRKLGSTTATPPEATVPAQPRKRGRFISRK